MQKTHKQHHQTQQFLTPSNDQNKHNSNFNHIVNVRIGETESSFPLMLDAEVDELEQGRATEGNGLWGGAAAVAGYEVSDYVLGGWYGTFIESEVRAGCLGREHTQLHI